MRIKDIKGIVNDILHLKEDINPLIHVYLKHKIKINLITGEIEYPEQDDIYKHYKAKLYWFKGRIRFLKGNLDEIEKAEFQASGSKESITIVFKGKTFKGEITFEKKGSLYTIKDKFNWKDKPKDMK